jgi:hypothetical protein
LESLKISPKYHKIWWYLVTLPLDLVYIWHITAVYSLIYSQIDLYSLNIYLQLVSLDFPFFFSSNTTTREVNRRSKQYDEFKSFLLTTCNTFTNLTHIGIYSLKYICQCELGYKKCSSHLNTTICCDILVIFWVIPTISGQKWSNFENPLENRSRPDDFNDFFR